MPGPDATITAINDSTSPIRIGSASCYRARCPASWDGLIDEVGVFERALTAAEVQSIFAADSGGMSAVAGVSREPPDGHGHRPARRHRRIRNVIGRAGNDILVGDGGNLLSGGAGRDLLIAGPRASLLFGGEGEDLLIGGTTTHDENPTSLDEVIAEWTRTDADYDTRLGNLRSGLLARSQVRSNGQQNGLFGEGDFDAFFGVIDLDASDHSEGESFMSL